MENICENCGAELKEGAYFCQECGSAVSAPTEDDEINFCPNCGSEIADGDFCDKCGTNLKNPQTNVTKNILEKYKIPIIIGGIILVLIFAGLIINSMQEPEPIELPAQTVTVGAEYFEIPGRFALGAGPLDIDTANGVTSFSQSFKGDMDVINIAVLSSGYGVDLEEVVASQGGVHKNLMGYDGYYSELDMGDYSFAFVLDNKICVIETTSPYLFDEIKVL